MVKNSGWAVLAVVVGAMVMQGCTQTGGVRTDAPSATMSSAVTAPPQSAVLPRYKKGKPVVKADTREDFEAVAAAVIKQMQPGGRWQYIDKNERKTVDETFADMRGLYDKFGSVDNMDSAAKIRLLADQSTVNAVLNRKDGERLICQNEIPVGSHLQRVTCKTYAQMQAEQYNAQDYLRRHAPTIQTKGGGG
ncbi:MAG TPA: hypothetical protein VFJ87_12995 [Rhodanobacteraceae bacterium]|nr:hypothetical protein [Rhodanobacteraceae bacterium]